VITRNTAWMAWKRDTARPAHRHSAYLLGGRVRTPCGRYFHGRTAGRDSPVYVCRHRKQTRADDPERCACRSIPVQTLDDAVWSHLRTALTTPPPPLANNPPRRRRPHNGNRRSGGSGGSSGRGSSLDIGADTLLPRIADAAGDVSRLQQASPPSIKQPAPPGSTPPPPGSCSNRDKPTWPPLSKP
jgi:hypothetical protein